MMDNEILRITSFSDFKREVEASYSTLNAKLARKEGSAHLFPCMYDIPTTHLQDLRYAAQRQQRIVDTQFGRDARSPVAHAAHYLNGVYEQITAQRQHHPMPEPEKLEQHMRYGNSRTLQACHIIGALHVLEDNITMIRMTLEFGLGVGEHGKAYNSPGLAQDEERFFHYLSITDPRFKRLRKCRQSK